MEELPKEAPWWMRWMVDEWRECWRWLSVQLALLVTAAPLLYDHVNLIQAHVSESLFHDIIAVLGFLIVIGRLKRQGE